MADKLIAFTRGVIERLAADGFRAVPELFGVLVPVKISLGGKRRRRRRENYLPCYETLEVRAMLDADGDYDNDSSPQGDTDGDPPLDGDGDYDYDSSSNDTDGDSHPQADGDGDYDGDTAANDPDHDSGGGGGGGGGGSPSISVSGGSVLEGGTIDFTVSYANMPTDTTIGYGTTQGTALAGIDFTSINSSTVVSDSGSFTVSVSTLDDGGSGESDQNFTLAASGDGVSGSGTGTVNEDADPPPPPSISVTNNSAAEGSSISFTINYANMPNGATLSYSTADGTATAGTDYSSTSGSLPVSGNGSTTVTVPTLDDNAACEEGQSFTISASGDGVSGSGTGTINEDDDGAALMIGDAKDLESKGQLVFPVTLTEAASGNVTVNYTTIDGTGSNAATQSEDYTKTSGSITIVAPALSGSIVVPIAADGWQPNDETFQVQITSAQVPACQGTATGTIEQGPPPVMSISNATVAEGGTETFTVTLSAPSAGTTTATFATSDGSALAGVDYTTISKQVTFDPYVTSTTVTVPTEDDNYGNESNEQFFATLSNPSGAALGTSQGTATITEDGDPSPTISIADASGPESAGSLTFNVTLSGPSGPPVTVQYSTEDNSATSAEDYTAQSGSVTLPMGVTTEPITVPITDDPWQAADETFFVNLSSTNFGQIARPQATGTIQQGPEPTLSIADASLEEPASGSADMVFTITLSHSDSQAVTFNYATSDGTASAAQGDYDTTSGQHTFNPGETQFTVSVPIHADELDGLNEQFYMNLSNASPVAISRNQATGTIFEVNGGQPTISIADASVEEPTDQMVFNVSLSAPTTKQVSVTFTTSDGTGLSGAVASEDYSATTETVVFPPNATLETVVVNIATDPWSPLDETFFGNLSSPINGTIARGQAVGTIIQGPPPVANIGNVMGPETAGTFNFKVTLSAPSSIATTIDYKTTDATAKSREDYAATSGTLTIPPDTTTAIITVPIVNDPADDQNAPAAVTKAFGVQELPTRFYVDLSNPGGGATIGKSEGIGVIYDPKVPPNRSRQCTCSCGCGNLDVEPDRTTGAMTAHFSFLSLFSGNTGNMMGGLTFQGQDQPHPVVTVADQLSPDIAGATSVTAQLTLGGITGPAVYYNPAGYTQGQNVLFSAQVDAGSLATGRYAYTMTITENYPGGVTEQRAYTGYQDVLNLDQTPVGKGWMLRGMARLYPQADGVSLSDGAGNLDFFTLNQDGSYSRPLGEPGFSTLVKNGDGSFTLTDKNQNVSNFSAAGLLTSQRDASGNTDVFNYDSSTQNILSTVDAEGRQTNFGYLNGQLSTIQDFAGRTINLGYDSGGHLTQVEGFDPGHGEARPVTNFAYDSATGQMTGMTDASGTTNFSYDQWRALTKITHPDNSTSLLKSTDDQALVDTSGGVGTASNPAPLVYATSDVGSQTDENGATSTFTAGVFGQDASDTDALGNTTTTVQNGEGEVVQITAPPLAPGGQPLVTTQVWDSQGNLIERDLPDGSKETWTFDPKFNEPTSYVDPLGHQTLWTIDQTNGDVLTQTVVMGSSPNSAVDRITTFSYTAAPTSAGQPPAGLVSKVVDPMGVETDFNYDGHANLLSVDYAVGKPDQATVSYAYNSADDRISATDELGRQTLFVVDGLDRTIETDAPPPNPSQPSNRPKTFDTFDALGHLITEVDPRGLSTSAFYNSDGQLIKLQQPDPAGGTNYTITGLGYDDAGDNTTITSPLSRITTLIYDADRRVIGQRDPNPADGSATGGPATSVVLDAAGYALKEFDAAGSETDNSFDWRGDLLSTTGPAPTPGAARPTVTFQYDADGQLVQKVDALGRTTSYRYDNAGNLINEFDPSPDGVSSGPVLTWTYDKDGNVVSFENALHATVEYVRDDLGRETEEIDPSPDGVAPQPTTQYQYDLAGQLTETIQPDGEVTQFSHDGDGNLTGVIAPDPATGGAVTDGSTKTTYAYDFDSNEIAETGPDLTTTFNTFDDLNQEIQQTGPPPASGLPAPVTTWQLDAEGEVLREVDPLGRAQTNQYDGMGREIQSVSFAGVEQQYGYDVLSNLTSQSLVGAGQPTETTTQGYDALSREVLTTAPDGGQTTTGYDLANNVVSLVDPAGNSSTWQVDGLDRVVKDTNAGGTRTFGYDLAGEVTSELDRDGRYRTFQYNTLGQQTTETWLSNQAGASATVSVAQQGSGGYADTVQTITFPSGVTGGSFTITVDGEVTSSLAVGATAAAVQSALAALPVVGAGNVSVTGQANPSYVVTFVGALSGESITQVSVQPSLTYDNGVTVSELTAGQPQENAVDTVAFSGAASDTYQLGKTTTIQDEGPTTTWVTVAYSSTAAQVQADIATLFSNVLSVTGSWPNFTVTFNGPVDPSASPFKSSTFVGNSHATVTGQSAGQNAQNEEQEVQLDNGVGGSFTLSFDGQPTAAIPATASATDVQNALDALSNIGSGGVSVGAGSPGSWDVVFEGSELSDRPEPLMVGNGAGLTRPSMTISGQPGSSGPDTVQDLTIVAASGTFTLSYDDNGTYVPTPAIAWPTQPATIKQALNALPGISAVTVTGSGTQISPFQITFAGTQSGNSVPALTADASQLLNVAHTFTTAYNGDGQIVSAGDTALGHAVSQYAMTYDGDGRVKTVDNAGTPGVPDVVLASGYNVMGDRTSLSATIAGTKDFLNNYSYDALGEMTAETQQGQSGGNAVAPKGISFGYDAIGDITSVQRYTNLTQAPSPATDAADTTLGYSSLGQLTSIVHSHNGTTIEGLGYAYDTLSRVDSISSTIDGGTALGYDVNSQLVSATYTGSYPPPNETETYDKNGNRTNAGYTIGPDNQITSDGVFNFGHDGEGNVTSRTRISTSYASDYQVVYSWDFRNRLTDTYFYDNNHVLTKQVHDVYDVFDQLIEQDVETFGGGPSTQTVHHVWDGEGIVLDFNGQSQLTERYLNGPNTSATDSVFSTLAEEQVNSLTSQGTVTFNLLDHLGSMVDVVDANGVLQDHIDYDVFGGVDRESNSAIHHLTGFAGGLPDPNTGLVLFGHRWYDAAHAVWMSPDPIGFLAGDPNEQRYVGNDPANFSDPSGEKRRPVTQADIDKAYAELRQKGVSGYEFAIRHYILYRARTSNVEFGGEKTSFRNPKYWVPQGKDGPYIVKPGKSPRDAIRNLVFRQDKTQRVACQKLSSLMIILAYYDWAGHLTDPKLRAAYTNRLNKRLRGVSIPTGLPDEGKGIVYTEETRPPGSGFTEKDLLPGDQIWFANPIWNQLTETQKNRRRYDGEGGSNVFYLGGGLVLQIYPNHGQHDVMTIAEKQRVVRNYRCVRDLFPNTKASQVEILRVRRPVLNQWP